MSDRCRWAIRFGKVLNTRCKRPASPIHDGHMGPGITEFPYQTIHWYAGDRREYQTDRDELFAWEQPPCPVPSSITGAECLLPEGHPQDSPARFHRYPNPRGGLE